MLERFYSFVPVWLFLRYFKGIKRFSDLDESLSFPIKVQNKQVWRCQKSFIDANDSRPILT